jgi:hypothetical protein
MEQDWGRDRHGEGSWGCCSELSVGEFTTTLMVRVKEGSSFINVAVSKQDL